MARGTARCTCSTCGAEFVKYNYNCYNRAAADSWEKWAEEHFDTCPDCYKEQVKAQNMVTPVKMEANFEFHNNHVCYTLIVISDNAYDRRKDLRAAGFDFQNNYWRYWIPVSKEDWYENKGEKLKEDMASYLASHVDLVGDVRFVKLTRQFRRPKKDEVEKWFEAAIQLEKIGEKPEWPEEFEAAIAGKRWNGRFYKGQRIYISGVETVIDDDLYAEVMIAKAARDAWEKKYNELLGE